MNAENLLLTLTEEMLKYEIDIEIIKHIKSMFAVELEKYDITEKETSLVKYEDFPICYKTYMVSQKINGMSEKTLKLYNIVLKDFLLSINKELTNITVNDIRLYLFTTQEKRKISNRTLDNRRTIINSFLEWCTNEGYLDKNPCRNIKPIKYSVKEREPLTPIQLEKVRNACTTDRERALIEFLYSTGCRVSEVANVKIQDIDFNKMQLEVLGKGNKYRTVYLTPKCVLYLQKYISDRKSESDYLFIHDIYPYNNLKKAGIEKIVKNIGERADLGTRLFPHLIRHTTATDCIQRGMSVENVQKVLGHSNINTTMIYAKNNEEFVKYEHKRCIL